jgi:RHS repeat-associated protein
MLFRKEVEPVSAPVRQWQLPEPKRPRIRSDEVARKCILPNGAGRVEIYGLDGRLHRSEEPDGSWIVFRYDLEGDLRAVEDSAGERVTYDSLSDEKILRSTTDRCETTVEFDENGFPARLTQRVDEFEWTIAYRRDQIGRVTGCLYPQAYEWLESTGLTTRESARTDVHTGSQNYYRVTVAAQEQSIEFGDGTRTVLSTLAGTELQKITCRDSQDRECLVMSFTRAEGRLVQAGPQKFEFDAAGRLASCTGPDRDLRYEYDDAGRLARVTAGNQLKEFAYEHAVPIRINEETLNYDAFGRRTARGNNTYQYNFFGQLTEATVGEERVRYVYDGFGRLVAREQGGERVYYVVDFEGHRIAEAAADGVVRRSYLWQGTNCVGVIDGIIGGPLAHTFHRSYSGRLYAVGTNGEIVPARAFDPYGADQLRSDGIPTFASLFSDPLTGLYHAGSRWFDPDTAHFLTPDGWFGTDTWNHLPPAMRTVLDALPGGTNVENTPENAYTWCRYDPINYADPNGHSAVATGFGLVFSMISFFLWQMQITSISLKMAALNFIVMIIPSIIDGIVSAARDKPLMGVNIFNAILPIMGSSRLMVPWAFPFNSLYNAADSVFTMGSVVWMRGSSNRELDERAERDILVCPNANTYLAANSVAADTFAVPRRTIKGTGTMNVAAAPDLITAPALDPVLAAALGAPATVGTVFFRGDPIGIRKAAGGQEEFVTILRFAAGGDIQLDAALPSDFSGVAIEFFRLDPGFVKVENDGNTVARTITFIRNSSIHYGNQLPDVFPATGIIATEFAFKEERKPHNFDAHNEFELIQFSAGDIGSYHAGDFIRVLSGTTYFGRKIERLHGSRNVILDAPLPSGGAATLDPKVVVTVMTASAVPPANNQTSNVAKVTVGTVRALRKHNGLAIAVGGGAVQDRRIVLQTFLRCTINNLPGALQRVPLHADLLIASTTTTGNGEVTAANTVKMDAGQASRFQGKRAVRIRNAAGRELLTLIQEVTTASEEIQLVDNLGADFPVSSRMTIVALDVARENLVGEPVAAPGGTLEIKSDDLRVPVADSLLLVKPQSGPGDPVVRKVQGDPIVVAQVDSPPTNNANLTVTVFLPDDASTHTGEAKKVIVRLTPRGGPHPYARNDNVYCRVGRDEYIGTNIAAAGDVVLQDPITTPAFGTAGSFDLQLVAGTGAVTADASLSASLVAIPSDPDEEPVSRLRAVQLHEMRHVWQYAVLGPFFFSQPLPWLVRLGFDAADSSAFSDHKWLRLISVSGLEKLFSLVAWGISGGLGHISEDAKVKETAATGTVANAERTAITFDAAVAVDVVGDFTDRAAIEVVTETASGPRSTSNIVGRSLPDQRKIELRFPLEEAFPQGTAVRVSVSPFEKIDAKLNSIFNLAIWELFLPRTWSHVLKSFMNQENWFPALGLYPLTLWFRAGDDQTRVYFEQDASFQSGDLYSSFGVSYPNEIFVGEFSRVLSFIKTRATDPASGLSDLGNSVTRALTIEPQAIPAGKTARDLVLGTTSAGGNLVRFRKEFMLPIHEKVENAIGAMFLSTTPGEYKVRAFDEWSGADFSLDNMVDPALFIPPIIPFFPASFNELRIIKVKRLGVQREFTAAAPLFETEQTTFTITGAEHVNYSIEYKGAPPAPRGDIAVLTFTAPRLAAGQVTHHLAIKATYLPDHSIFRSSGKLHDLVTLPAASLSNVCQDLDIVIAPIVVDAVGPVRVGTSVQFNASISPQRIDPVTVPAEARVQADLRTLGGRPARLTFRAPSNVNTAKDVVFRLTFGTAPHTREIDVTIRVQP